MKALDQIRSFAVVTDAIDGIPVRNGEPLKLQHPDGSYTVERVWVQESLVPAGDGRHRLYRRAYVHRRDGHGYVRKYLDVSVLVERPLPLPKGEFVPEIAVPAFA